MSRTLRYLSVTTLAVGLAAGIAWGKGKPGGDGSGGGDTSTVPVEAHFIGHLSDNGGTYKGSTVPGGRVELPATGNFTMDLKGSGRKLNLDFSNDSLPGEAEVFLSINRHCLDDAYDGTNDQGLNLDGSCKDFAATEGSLAALRVNGTPLLLGVHMTFAKPDSRNSYWVKCGAAGGDVPDDFQEAETDWVRAICENENESGCTQWHLTPIAGAMAPLICRVFEKSNKSLTLIGDEDLSFDLRLYRDQP